MSEDTDVGGGIDLALIESKRIEESKIEPRPEKVDSAYTSIRNASHSAETLPIRLANLVFELREKGATIPEMEAAAQRLVDECAERGEEIELFKTKYK